METFALVSVCVSGHCSISPTQGTGTTCSTPRSGRRTKEETHVHKLSKKKKRRNFKKKHSKMSKNRKILSETNKVLITTRVLTPCRR